MDIFIEQVVKKKKTFSEKIRVIFVIVLSIVIPVALASLAWIVTAYFIYIAFFALCGFIFFDVWFVKNQNVEFEYQVVGNTLAVDKVVDKRKRKKVLRVKIPEIQEFYYVHNEKDNRKFSMYYMCADDIESKDCVGAVFHDEAKGNCCLFFSPNEKVLNAMKIYLSSDIQLKFFHKREK